MDNSAISDVFSLLAKLMDIHGENGFRAKSYANTAFTIDKLPAQLSETPKEKWAGIKGIGDSSAKKIEEILTTGSLLQLQLLIDKTPPGILEMMRLRGIGPKKINTIWKEMEIESLGELLYACQENRLKLYKGFGDKTQQSIMEIIEFYFSNRGHYLYGALIPFANEIENLLNGIFGKERVAVSGKFRRQIEVIEQLEFVINENVQNVLTNLSLLKDFTFSSEDNEKLTFTYQNKLSIQIHCVTEDDYIFHVVRTSASDEFFEALKSAGATQKKYSSEEDLFTQINLPYIPSARREKTSILNKKQISEQLSPAQIKGVIHSHSTWSDGSNTIEEMANACIEKGYEYLVLSDHSKSAFYASGLFEEKIIAQHAQIDELNTRLAPFKIFKSIESDILNDGSLDYSEDVLKTFDLVIASVHTNLKMTEEKANQRLVKAIENPYTTILGHPTGRLLLARKGYPINYEMIIDACIANNVAIEINANPLRLDMDWRFVDEALEKGAVFSIDPDAHSTAGIDDIFYGVFSAQKTLLSTATNLSSFSLQQFENYIKQIRTLKSI